HSYTCSTHARTAIYTLALHYALPIFFHLLTEGHGYAQVEGDDRPLPLNAGDILIVPHGDPHAMRNGPLIKPVDHAEEIRRILSRSEEHTSELQSRVDLVCHLLLEKKE